MKNKSKVVNSQIPSAPTWPHNIGDLLASLREVIQTARQHVLRTVDVVIGDRRQLVFFLLGFPKTGMSV
jgi:hypothetical protein